MPRDGTTANSVSYMLEVLAKSTEYPANFLKVAWVTDDSSRGLGAITWPAFAWTTNQTYILHIPLPEELDHLRLDTSGDFWSKSWENTKVTGYAILQVRKTDEGLAIAEINEEVWASEIKSGKLQGTVTSHDLPKNRTSVNVTSTRSELRMFLETHFDDAFDKNPSQLRRLTID